VLNVPLEDGVPEMPRSPTMLHGIALTANDLQEVADDGQDNHTSGQKILQSMMSHRGIATLSSAPYIDQDDEYDESNSDHRRKDFTARVLGRLRERGIHGVRSFRLQLHHMDLECTGTVLARTFEGALAHLGVRLKKSEFDRLLELFTLHDDENMVDYVRFLSFGVGNWSRQREEVVAEAFDILSQQCPGGLLEAEMLGRNFQPAALTAESVPGMAEHESAQEFLTQWSDSNLAPDGVIRWNDFLDYYMDTSLCFASDQDFCAFVCASWGINADDWLAKKVFRKYTDSDRPDCLVFGDFAKMVRDLDPSMSEEEAMAWYAAIDDDESGEISLEEFLSSKVLKVKRLFDEFDPSRSRVVNKATMLNILRSLNPNISEEDAEAVYAYADNDYSGDVSFSEFLENNLLKLLLIFDDFVRKRRRSCSQADLKQLLLRLDPLMSDSDTAAVYKAIDTDGSCEISFVEFCESNVLRAKALFDRYDTTHSGALTQFKFQQLVTEMDSSLKDREKEVMYNLVMDSNDGKVHFSGFLNPNVIRLKMLFDRYDQDKSRYLDGGEFKCMLKDIFQCCGEGDIDQLVEILCPAGKHEGVSFITYFCRYKDISRKHEQLHLAKRRAAKEKAKARGLVWNG